MSNKYVFEFCKTLKLAPSLGDWTKLTPFSLEDSLSVGDVGVAAFNGLPKDVLNQLHSRHYRFSERLMVWLSESLGVTCELAQVKTRQVPYRFIEEHFQDEMVGLDFEIPKQGVIHSLFDYPLVNLFVERLMGGGLNLQEDGIQFSDVDKNVLETFLKEMGAVLFQSWPSLKSPEDLVSRVSYGKPMDGGNVRENDGYIIFEFDISFPNLEFQTIRLCYSNFVLRSLLLEADKHVEVKPRQISLNTKSQRGVQVPVCVNLGHAKLAMGDVRNLQVGDVVSLNTMLSDGLMVELADVCSFSAQGGRISDKYGVQIIHPETMDMVVDQVYPFVSDSDDDDDDDDVESETLEALPAELSDLGLTQEEEDASLENKEIADLDVDSDVNMDVPESDDSELEGQEVAAVDSADEGADAELGELDLEEDLEPEVVAAVDSADEEADAELGELDLEEDLEPEASAAVDSADEGADAEVGELDLEEDLEPEASAAVDSANEGAEAGLDDLDAKDADDDDDDFDWDDLDED